MRKPPTNAVTRMKREAELVVLAPPLLLALCFLAVGAAVMLHPGPARRTKRTEAADA